MNIYIYKTFYTRFDNNPGKYNNRILTGLVDWANRMSKWASVIFLFFKPNAMSGVWCVCVGVCVLCVLCVLCAVSGG